MKNFLKYLLIGLTVAIVWFSAVVLFPQWLRIVIYAVFLLSLIVYWNREAIGIYFAKRRALREYRRELEHKREMEKLAKRLEMIAAVAQMTELVAKSAQAFIEERNRKHPPGGIAMPGNSKGPEVDDREWFVNGERVISRTPTDKELVVFKKRWQAQQPNFTPKEMEAYNKYLSGDEA